MVTEAETDAAASQRTARIDGHPLVAGQVLPRVREGIWPRWNLDSRLAAFEIVRK